MFDFFTGECYALRYKRGIFYHDKHKIRAFVKGENYDG